MWPFKRKTEAHRRIKLINRGVCLVEIGFKSIRIAIDWDLSGKPDFWVNMTENMKWGPPSGEKVSKDELDALVNFIPCEFRRRYDMEAKIRFVEV